MKSTKELLMNAYYYVQEYFEKITEIQLRKIHWL